MSFLGFYSFDRFRNGKTGIVDHHVELGRLVENVLEVDHRRRTGSYGKRSLWCRLGANADQGEGIIATRGG